MGAINESLVLKSHKRKPISSDSSEKHNIETILAKKAALYSALSTLHKFCFVLLFTSDTRLGTGTRAT